jgi:hypothetical protein
MEAENTILVQIVGSPVACAEGLKDVWREVADWAARQLENRFGEAVSVRYYDLFEANCPPLPQGVKLPVVLVAGELFSSGEKISVPGIRKVVERMIA